MNSPLLALETSGTRCSVALWRAGPSDPVVTDAFHDGAQAHAERLLPLVSQLLSASELSTQDIAAVAFGQGPGSFTGLRVACAIAQGIGMALSVPLVPIGTLDAVADQVPREAMPRLVVVAMDARMQEVYASMFLLEAAASSNENDSAPRPLFGPVLLAATDLSHWIEARLVQWRAQHPEAPVVYTGDAWAAYADILKPDSIWTQVDIVRPEATAIARLGVLAWQQGFGIDPADAMPLYVRDKVAFTTAERLAGSGGNPKAVSPDAERTG